MAAIINGLALHGGFMPYGGTFLVFSDYARNAIRMSALMHLRVVYVFTHDSIGLGEDGPTHQPIEHRRSPAADPESRRLAAVRRGGDGRRLDCRRSARQRSHRARAVAADAAAPAAHRMSRSTAIARGGYVLVEAGAAPAAIIIATGSEVKLARAAAEMLAGEGMPVRVVSMPCVEAFERQPKEYRTDVLPATCPRSRSKPASRAAGGKYAGSCGAVVGIDRFGESAPGKELFALVRFHAGARGRGRRAVVDRCQLQ